MKIKKLFFFRFYKHCVRSEAINSCLEEKPYCDEKSWKCQANEVHPVVYVWYMYSNGFVQKYSFHQILFSSIFYCSKNNVAESKEACNIL